MDYLPERLRDLATRIRRREPVGGETDAQLVDDAVERIECDDERWERLTISADSPPEQR